MGLKVNENYINFKIAQKKRVFKNEVDTLEIEVMVNIFKDIEKNASISRWVNVEMPYNPSISDSDIYNLLKNTSVSYSDVFGQEIILDLTKAEYLI